MIDLPENSIGAAWLLRRYRVRLLGQLPVVSQTRRTRRSTQTNDQFRLETWPESMRPENSPAAHLQFHLRHEIPHLEFLARLFEESGPDFVQDWVIRAPTGQYARRAAFLYEWLTGQKLAAPDRLGGNYVDAIDDTKLLAASPEQAVKVPRWRVNDNLPGTRHFCPTVVKTEAVNRAAALDIAQLYDALSEEFGADLLMRASVWMTLRESKASFAIEGEPDHVSRVQRFANVMAQRTGQGPGPLDDATLAELQRAILGKRTTLAHFGIRKSPVFVGQTVRYEEVVHYVAPPAQDVAAMLEGLRVFLDKTQGQSAILRSAVAAFGLVYIHPLADGNGRVHRFLVNDVLRRDGIIPAPVILPLSAIITDDPKERLRYDQVLDLISKPLMQAVSDQITFSPVFTRYPDGIESNFAFHGDSQARALWRYPDLGPHSVFLSHVIERSLNEQMREESQYLRRHAQTRAALKEVVEMPDQQADRVLRALEQNQGKLSHALSKELPVLAQDGVWADIVAAVSRIQSQ